MNTSAKNIGIVVLVLVLCVFGAAIFHRGASSKTDVPTSIVSTTSTPVASSVSTRATNNKPVITAVKFETDSTVHDAANTLLTEAFQEKNAGHYPQAIAALEKVTQMLPRYTTPYNNLGDIYLRYAPDYKKAELNYRKVIELDPQMLNSYIALFQLYTETSYSSSTAAEAIVRQALVAVPAAYNLEVDLARYYAKNGRLVDAQAEYDVAIKAAEAQGNMSTAADIQKEKTALR